MLWAVWPDAGQDCLRLGLPPSVRSTQNAPFGRVCGYHNGGFTGGFDYTSFRMSARYVLFLCMLLLGLGSGAIETPMEYG